MLPLPYTENKSVLFDAMKLVCDDDDDDGDDDDVRLQFIACKIAFDATVL